MHKLDSIVSPEFGIKIPSNQTRLIKNFFEGIIPRLLSKETQPDIEPNQNVSITHTRIKVVYNYLENGDIFHNDKEDKTIPIKDPFLEIRNIQQKIKKIELNVLNRIATDKTVTRISLKSEIIFNIK